MKGTFKWYNREKGYGFIKSDEDSKDYFVHYTALPEGQQDIREEGTIKVTFEVKETEKGTQAHEVVFVDSDEEDSSDEE